MIVLAQVLLATIVGTSFFALFGALIDFISKAKENDHV